MSKIVMLLGIACLGVGVATLGVGLGVFGYTWPPDWFFYLLGGSWGGAVALIMAGMVLDE